MRVIGAQQEKKTKFGPQKVNEWDGYLPSEKAAEINRDRMATYGTPVPNYQLFASFLEVYFGIPVSAEDAVVVVVLLKIVREKQGGFDPSYRDNLEDICGFMNVLHKVKEAHDSRPNGPSEGPGWMDTDELPG